MMIDRDIEPYNDDYRVFSGEAHELLPGDLVLEAQYTVWSVVKTSPPAPVLYVTFRIGMNHNGPRKPGVGAPPPTEVTLEATSKLWFQRRITVSEPAPEFDPECHMDFPGGPGYEEWDGINMAYDVPTRDLVPAALVVFGPKAEILDIDSAYETGVILFADGRAYQSHPDLLWRTWGEV